MVIGDDLDVIVLPDTDTTVRDEIITLENMISTEGNLRVGGAQIDTDSFARHSLKAGFDGWGGECESKDSGGAQKFGTDIYPTKTWLDRACLSHEEVSGREWNLREHSKKT